MRVNRACSSCVLLVREAGSSADWLQRELAVRGYTATHVTTFTQAIGEVHSRQYPLVLFDLAGSAVSKAATASSERCATVTDSPANEALEALRELRRISPASQVVVMVEEGVNLTTCCQAVVYGAASFVEWKLGDPVERVVERLEQAYERYEAALEEGRDLHSTRLFDETGLAGQSQVMAKLLFHAKRAAMISDVPVLITGESGTGKQLLAEAIHRMDPKRRNKPFLTVNCAAITGSLAESALFGHRKGAFTGANEDRPGYFQAANGGTILLDEIAELEKPLQPKLLRVLQAGRVLPVGADAERQIDVRVIAAGNRPLEIMVEKNEFRLDLYQRLNVINLNVPPLRERPEDIPLLVQFFLRRYAADYAEPIAGVDERVYEVLARSIGSGNVRELENAIRQILVFKKAGNRIELADIPPGLLQRLARNRQEDTVTGALASAVEALLQSGRMTLPEMVEQFELIVLREAISRSNLSHTELASRLGLSRRTFYNKLNRYDLTGS